MADTDDGQYGVFCADCLTATYRRAIKGGCRAGRVGRWLAPAATGAARGSRGRVDLSAVS